MPTGKHVWKCLFLCVVSSMVVTAQDMAWLGGNKMADEVSVSGAPGGRSGMGVWQDSNSTLWMFGGIGTTSHSPTAPHPIMLNDVWHFSNSNQSWQQVHPGTISNLTVAISRSPQIPRPRQLASVCGKGHVMVVFGGVTDEDVALGDLWVFDVEKRVWRMLVEAYTRENTNETEGERSRNVGPEPRGDSAYWCTSTHLFIFGGMNVSNIFKDMWRLSLEDFTWEELESSRRTPASQKDQKVAGYPEGRHGAMTWTWLVQTDSVSDSQSETDHMTLFMFGGNIMSKYLDRHLASGYTSDMWKYLVNTDTWSFVTGSVQPGQPAQYGHQHAMTLDSVPGCRRGGATWTDGNSLMWLFGGQGADSEMPSPVRSAKLLADQWRFHPKYGQWEWMGGSQKGDSPANFKEKGKLTHTGLAGGRCDAATWRRADGQVLYLFGGLGQDGQHYDGYLSDLWLLDISNTVTYHFYIPAVYGFGIIFTGLALLLCLFVVALYARDRSKPPQWRRSGVATRYSQLHDSDT